MRLTGFLSVCVSPCASLRVGAEKAAWRLVWQDEFERGRLGDGWLLYQGKAATTDGRLTLSGEGATLLIARSFTPDVRLEFDAQADPQRPPCDLSVTLAASELYGYHHVPTPEAAQGVLHPPRRR